MEAHLACVMHEVEVEGKEYKVDRIQKGTGNEGTIKREKKRKI